MKTFYIPSPRQGRPAFTLIELLVVIAVVAALASLLMPALAGARPKSQAIQCMNNIKQLQSAVLAYADDSNGIWVPNEPAGTGNQTDWVTVSMDWNQGNSDNTNTAKLLNPQYSLLAPYLEANPSLYKCPADNSFVPGIGPRVRSVSMNAAVGSVWVADGCLIVNGPVNGQWLTGANIGSGCQLGWHTYGKNSDFISPGPANTFVICDEHMDSINDAQLENQCAESGIGDPFIDRPSHYHDGACPFSFADGHVEMHKWLGPSLGASPFDVNGPNYSEDVQNQADLQDLIWYQQRTSARLP